MQVLFNRKCHDVVWLAIPSVCPQQEKVDLPMEAYMADFGELMVSMVAMVKFLQNIPSHRIERLQMENHYS